MYTDNKLGFGIPSNGRFSNNIFSIADFANRRGLPVPVPVPVPAAPVAITPYVPAAPVFPNIDNSAYYAKPIPFVPEFVAPASQPASYLPAGIKAVDYTAPVTVAPDYVKIGLYAVGAIGLMLLLSNRKGI